MLNFVKISHRGGKILRKILYADIEILDNYISIIDGCLYNGQEITQSFTINKGGKIGIGVKTINAEDNLGNQKEEKIALNRSEQLFCRI